MAHLIFPLGSARGECSILFEMQLTPANPKASVNLSNTTLSHSAPQAVRIRRHKDSHQSDHRRAAVLLRANIPSLVCGAASRVGDHWPLFDPLSRVR